MNRPPHRRSRAPRRLLALATAIVALSGAAPALAAGPDAPAGQSFDCAHAQGVVETTICTTPLLETQRQAMLQLYALVGVDALGVGPTTEADEQRKWQADLDQQCPQKAPTEIVACIRQEYDARLLLLAVAALMRAPAPALAELRRQLPDQAPLYEAIWRMATMPAGAARTSAVAALIGPEFHRMRTVRYDADDPVHGGAPALVEMLGPVRTAREAAASFKAFDLFYDLTGAVDVIPPAIVPCEAIVRQPALIHALDSLFGSSMDAGLGQADCDVMLPPPPKFADLAADALQTAAAAPDCTGTLRYGLQRAYFEFLIAVQLNRQGPPPRYDKGVARQAAAYASAHAAAVSAAQADLAAYYAAELHMPAAAASVAAHTAVGEVVDGAFATCP
jgi:uncharacterized protein